MSVWPLDVPPAVAYAALYEVVEYPRWWPEVKRADKLDEVRLFMRTRSLLPYDLSFTLIREIADATGGVLEARLEGDLEGRIRWTIEPTQAGSRVNWDQRVVTHRLLLDRFAPLARPAFVANHALMMRHGHAGLRTFVSGHRLGERQAGERSKALEEGHALHEVEERPG